MEKVLGHIKWNDSSIPLKEHFCKTIKKSLKHIKVIDDRFFTEGSKISNIMPSLHGICTELMKRIKEIKELDNVKSVDYRILVPA